MTDFEEKFEVFGQLDLTESLSTISRLLTSTQISINQGTTDIPEAMVLQRRKDTSLLELLESHAGGFTLEIAVQPWPLTPHPTYTSPSEQPEKKRKRDRKGKEVTKEGEAVPSKDLEPQKGAKAAKTALRKNTAEGSGMEIVSESLQGSDL